MFGYVSLQKILQNPLKPTTKSFLAKLQAPAFKFAEIYSHRY